MKDRVIHWAVGDPPSPACHTVGKSLIMRRIQAEASCKRCLTTSPTRARFEELMQAIGQRALAEIHFERGDRELAMHYMELSSRYFQDEVG